MRYVEGSRFRQKKKKVRLKILWNFFNFKPERQLFHLIMNAATLITRSSNDGNKQRIKGNCSWIIYPRAQLSPAAGLHPAEAVLLPGLWGDPGAAPQHVQEDVPPVDAWVLMLWRSRRVWAFTAGFSAGIHHRGPRRILKKGSAVQVTFLQF